MHPNQNIPDAHNNPCTHSWVGRGQTPRTLLVEAPNTTAKITKKENKSNRKKCKQKPKMRWCLIGWASGGARRKRRSFVRGHRHLRNIKKSTAGSWQMNTSGPFSTCSAEEKRLLNARFTYLASTTCGTLIAPSSHNAKLLRGGPAS